MHLCNNRVFSQTVSWHKGEVLLLFWFCFQAPQGNIRLSDITAGLTECLNVAKEMVMPNSPSKHGFLIPLE